MATALSRCTDPCVLVAMHRESSGLLHDFPRRQRFKGAPVSAWFCGTAANSFLLVVTGIGPEAVQIALDWIFSKPTFEQFPYEPKWLLYAGFAGALTADLSVGDLILATEVADLDRRRWRTTWPGDLPPGYQEPPLRRGTILSAPGIIADPREKCQLGQAHEALAVDMESATLARLCSQQNIHFGCLRAISDDCATSLSPNLVQLLSAGKVSPWQVFAALLRRPSLARELLRLACDTRLAAERLGRIVGELVRSYGSA